MAAQMNKNNKGATAETWQKSYFDVLGLCCSAEVPVVENIIKSLDGVKNFTVIVATRTLIVVHDTTILPQIQIVRALNQARLEANVRVNGSTKHKKKWPSPYAVASGVFLAISLFKYVYPPLSWVALGAVAAGILPILLKAFASVRMCRVDANVLMLTAVIGTIAMKDYIEAGTIVFLFSIAEWLESRASYKANAVMSSLTTIAPQKAVIAETGQEVNADEVKLNTVLAVKAGEVIPIDGVVVEGNCEVDEKTLTGESFPVPKQVDSTVWAGTINLNGYVSVRTTAIAEDCAVAKMAKLVEEAQTNKSATQRFVDKFAQYYTPVVLIMSACFVAVPLALRVHNLNHWFHLALVILVSACPCGLILSTPVATFCALTKAATAGLLIKGGDHLETLAKIKAMAFDKTGTITRGEFVVTDFRHLRDDISLDTLLYWVSSIESKSSHPMAAALVDYARLHSVEPKPDMVEEFQNFPGEGIQGKLDGKDIYIGNRKIAYRASGIVPTVEADKKSGKTVGYVYYGATPAGIFSLSDSCRTGAAEAIKELKSMGIKTAMLTGDNEASAMYAQEQLEHALEVVHAELLPEDKATIIKELKKGGPTAMIGDGLNDAPALATADIGISMGISGSALATETGHVILMSNDLGKVPKAIRLARKAHRKVIENVLMSMALKSAILALAFAGHPLVWAAVLTDVGTCLLVIFNSMLLLRGTHNDAGKYCKSSVPPLLQTDGNKKSSDNCRKNCCSSQNVEKVQSDNCDKNCFPSQEVKSDDCGNYSQQGDKVPLDNCSKNCCSSQIVKKVPSDILRKDCCSGKKGEKVRKNSCSSKKVEKVQSDNCGKNGCSSRKMENVPSDNHAICSNKILEKVPSDTSQNVKELPSDNCPKNGCSSKYVEKVQCGAQNSSCVSGRNQKCMNSGERHDGFVGNTSASGVQEAKDCNRGCCVTVRNDLEANYPFSNYCSGLGNLSSCSEDKCDVSVESKGKCIEGTVTDKAENCIHSCCEPANDHGIHSHSNHPSDEIKEGQNMTNISPNCCSDKCCQDIPNKDESSGEIVELSSCDQFQELKKCCEGCIPSEAASPSKSGLEKRRISGCCKSYRKECCKKGGRLGTSFDGGLSGIII